MKYNLDQAITRTEALELLKERWDVSLNTEYIPLQQALGRVTAQDLYAEHNLPVYRVSSFDGIAVHSKDFEHGIPDTSKWIKGRDYTPADTGDDFPDGFDTIIAAEDINYDPQGALHLSENLNFSKGNAVRAPGTMVKQGELLVAKRTKLTPELITALAIGGVRMVPVVQILRVAFLPTGNELVSTGIRPERGQYVEANGLMLASFLKEWGANTVCFPITKDNKKHLNDSLDEAIRSSNLVIINGGTSRGEEDFNASLLKEKADFFRHGVKAMPGRPVAISIIHGKPVINVPGPVMAAWLAADWLLSGLVHHYYGLPAPIRQKVWAKLESPITKRPPVEFLSRVELSKTENGFTAKPIPFSASIPYSLREMDGLLTVPIGISGYDAGDEVEVELLKGHELI